MIRLLFLRIKRISVLFRRFKRFPVFMKFGVVNQFNLTIPETLSQHG